MARSETVIISFYLNIITLTHSLSAAKVNKKQCQADSIPTNLATFAKVYKLNRGETSQGGLGGVGIENWILQNGGSFVDAANSFLRAAENRSFSEFQSIYPIWDFGENHLAERKDQYPHDNFVANNMSKDGYERMVSILTMYMKEREKGQDLQTMMDVPRTPISQSKKM